jgi:hypothetical protein
MPTDHGVNVSNFLKDLGSLLLDGWSNHICI